MDNYNHYIPDMDGDPFEIYEEAVRRETEDREWREYCAQWSDSWRKDMEESLTEDKEDRSVRDAAHTLYYRGLGYLYGEDCYRNPEKALAMITAAALTGECPNAVLRLAHMYEDGDGVDRDPDKAAYWYAKDNNEEDE